jgi:uncharacterized membrane protein
MHRTTWALQILLGIYFLVTGVIHLVVPEGLPDPMTWMYDLSPALHWIAGLAEIAGALGLVLPAATRIAPRLTPLAATGLALVMLPAAVWHATRGEAQSIVGNIVVAILLVLIAYVRTRTHPIETR